MSKKQQVPRNEKIWLPPIEACCKDISITFQITMNLEDQAAVHCPRHGTVLVNNPLHKSKHNVRFSPSPSLMKLILHHLTKKQLAKVDPQRIRETLDRRSPGKRKAIKTDDGTQQQVRITI